MRVSKRLERMIVGAANMVKGPVVGTIVFVNAVVCEDWDPVYVAAGPIWGAVTFWFGLRDLVTLGAPDPKPSNPNY